MHRGGGHRTEPASGPSSDCFFDNSRTSLDHFPLFFRGEVGKDRILCIGVASDLVSASIQLFDSFGKKLGAFGVEADRRSDFSLVEDSHKAPDAGFPAVLRPRNSQQVRRAWF